MKILLIPNDPLSAYSDIDRWRDRPRGYIERGHEVAIFPLGEVDMRALGSVIKQNEIDVVRTLEGGRFGITGWAGAYCSKLGVPLVASLHGNPWELDIARGYPQDYIDQHMAAMDAALKNVTRLLPVQLSMVYYFHKYYPEMDDRVTFLPNYVMPCFEEKCEPEDRIMFVGRLPVQDSKDIKTVLEACALVESDVDILFVGKGEMDKEIVKEGHRHIESVPNPEMPELYSKSKVTLQAYRYVSGFGVPALEAQACRRPLVLSRIGFPHLSVVEPESDVEYFMEPTCRVQGADEMADAIDDLLQDEKLWRKFGKQGRKRVEKNFGRDMILDREVEILEEVAGKP